jgi:molecular chaperone DnaJ
MYIQANVETPVNLTRRQRELLREFEDASRDNSPQSEGFFAKAKAFWEGFGS